MTTPRLSIELKNASEQALKRRALSKAIAENTSLRAIVLKALSEFCDKK